ncbi:Coatomer WD associated region [Arabidopsis thaliana x Arabidopsis arenosa]|uniref:Coatomer WD associated region n=1 Tax=Arabidopsis thaliana x Arabidopsis arenosa TaxID=1240361 RepID=A0A8T1XYJ3_9BRAS|nr:Coatomer WD associated region [Arabidopsis thaliana x Arabidopsis arenosa]
MGWSAVNLVVFGMKRSTRHTIFMTDQHGDTTTRLPVPYADCMIFTGAHNPWELAVLKGFTPDCVSWTVLSTLGVEICFADLSRKWLFLSFRESWFFVNFKLRLLLDMLFGLDRDMQRVALLSKHAIIIASKELVIQCMLHENKPVKSGAWDDENGVMIYTTLDHIKYCLPNGESGIIQTLDVPMYVTKVSGNRVFCLDREVRIRIIHIDATDYSFKLSLLRKNYGTRIDGSQLCGGTSLGWRLLGKVTEIAIYAHEQAKNVEQLSFLHLITGNMEKTVDVKDNVMSQFRSALYLGDVKERVKILENAGQLPLAYITASIHGLGGVAEIGK